MHVSFIKLSGHAADYGTLVSFERHRTCSDIASALYGEQYRSAIEASLVLIIRPPVDIPLNAKKIQTTLDEYRIISGRFPLKPFYILYSSGFRIRLSKNFNEKVPDIDNYKHLIGILRQRELEEFILDSNAIIKTPNANTLFRTPSQEYSHIFLRVGNIQKSRHVLDAIFFWTLPSLKHAGALLTDSWSISSLSLNIARLLARYVADGMKSDGVGKIIHNFHVNMLSGSYHGLRGMDQDTRERLQPLLYNNQENILFLISAVKTEKSLANIKKALIEEGLDKKVKYLALYSLVPDTHEKFLCDLSGEFSAEQGISFDSIDRPPNNETVVPIDRQTFFPMQTKDELIEIKKACADISKDFFETYSGKNIFSLHRQSTFFNKSPLRHHGIYIDVAAMLDCPPFLDKLKEQLALIQVPPACIIYPPHDQGKLLVDRITTFFQDKFNFTPEVFCFADLEVLPLSESAAISQFLESLSETDTVLIVDDVSITGNRLSNYQRTLHEKKFKGKIHYFVGVARPTSEEDWKRRKRILAYDEKYSLTCIEKVILPDWTLTTCPWCREMNLLKRVIASSRYLGLSVTNQLVRRLNMLSQAESTGLTDDVFFSITNTKKPQFMGKSIFCNKKDISEADLVASIAGSMQHLRNGIIGPKNIEYKLEVAHPVYKIIHPGDYLKGFEKLYEPLIKASVIRCCSNKELSATEDTNLQQQKEYIKGFLSDSRLTIANRSFFIYELYLAIKLLKLPKPDIEEKMRDILERLFNS
ncbi:MAG: hypothetical protein KGM16_11075 [Bacteroidota bacterium]|nr:hypothetical protein [Bacteroidota bacterium]